MKREEVARHQRARLYGGMIESISRRGYASTTVAQVICLAGVSRRAFYEQFANKEACFLATYDIAVVRSRKQVLEAWGSERGWDNRLHASYRAFLDHVVAEPKSARLVLIDGLGIGAKSRERLNLAGNAYERLLCAAFKVSPDAAPLPRIAARAMVGGVRQVVFNRVRENHVRELRTLADELLDWVEAYRTPAIPRLNAIALKTPPEIPLAEVEFLAAGDTRAKVLSAIVHLTLDEGYSELSDPRIAQFAGISTEAFHKQFRDKEACFLTAIDEFVAETLTAVEDAIAGAGSWSQAVPIAVSTLIYQIVARPALLKLTFIDLFDVGPGMIDRMTSSIARFTELLTAGAPEPRRAPEIVSEAITGAIWDIISTNVSSERMCYLPCLVNHIAFIVLAPYTGPKDAIEAIERTGRRRRLALVPKPAPELRSAPGAGQVVSKPGSRAGSASKSKPTANSGAQVESASKSKPASRSGSQAGSAPKSKPSSKSVSQAKSAPQSKLTSKAKSPASKAKSTDASKPTSGSKAADRVRRAAAERVDPESYTYSRSRRRPPK